MVTALRHADLSAAMCQEAIGDMSKTTRVMLDAQAALAVGKPLNLETGSTTSNVIDETVEVMKKAGVNRIERGFPCFGLGFRWACVCWTGWVGGEGAYGGWVRHTQHTSRACHW